MGRPRTVFVPPHAQHDAHSLQGEPWGPDVPQAALCLDTIERGPAMRVAALGTGPVFDRVVPALARSGFDVVAALDCDPAADSGRNGRPEPIRFVRSLDELASHTWDLCLVCDYQRLLPADFVRAGTVVNCHGG